MGPISSTNCSWKNVPQPMSSRAFAAVSSWKWGCGISPLLDEYQDEIFRLPLDSRVVILAPPERARRQR